MIRITIDGPPGCGKTALMQALNKLICGKPEGFVGTNVSFRVDEEFKLIAEGANREIWELESAHNPRASSDN